MAFPTQSLALVAASSQYATASDSASFDTMSGDATIEGWFKFATLPGVGNSVTLISRDPSDATNRVWEVRLFNVAGIYSMAAYNSTNGTNGGTSSNILVTNTTTLTTGTWFHMAWTFTSGTLQTYINGSSQGSLVGINASMYTGGNSVVRVGATAAGTPSNFYDGRVGLVRIWSVARTGTQILDNYCTSLGSTSNLVAEWTLDNTYNDNSGNTNTLTPSNTPSFVVDVTAVCPVTVTYTFVPQLLTLNAG